MEVYTLDNLLRRTELLDRFESLIWTERYQDSGDFELIIRSTMENRNFLKAGVRLAMSHSKYVMTIETVETEIDSLGNSLLKLSGPSLETMLEDRVAATSLEALSETSKWVLSGTPAVVARKIFHDICVLGKLKPSDKIPFIKEGSLLPEDTIPEPEDPIEISLDPTSVYSAIKNLCEVWNLGFRLLRNFDESELYFDIYTGTDRTSGQSIVPPVIFAPNLDNLQNVKELTTMAGAKNVAYVFSPAGFLEVYPPNIDPEIEGFDRRVLVVTATDITSELPDVPAALLQRGLEELAKTRMFQAFDGEVSQHSEYQYGSDYYLGDLVEVRNFDEAANVMRVTEQIFVSDREGERSYPTLTINQFINTGSWLSWSNNITWYDLREDPTTWSEQP